MLAALRQLKWLMAGIVVVTLAALFVALGFWQLDRHEHQNQQNALGLQRMTRQPVALSALLSEASSAPASIEYRRVSVTGEYLTEEEVWIRSQVHLGTAGFHVITPLRHESGTVLVNRGWIPLGTESVPSESGVVTIEGLIRLTQTRGFLSPEDPAGKQKIFSRVDINRLEEQMSGPLDPVYLVTIEADRQFLPIPIRQPTFDDAGPHLGYAIQWFGFAVVGLVGFFFLIRRKGAQGR